MTLIFAFQFPQKIIKTIVLIFCFVVVVYSVSMFFLSSLFYKKLSHYFNDNNKRSLIGESYLIIQYGFKNMIIGFSHALLRPLPFKMVVTILIILEMVFFIMFIVSIRLSIYKIVVKIWCFMLLNVIKLMIIFTFLWDIDNTNNPLIEGVQQMLLFFQIGLFCLGILL